MTKTGPWNKTINLPHFLQRDATFRKERWFLQRIGIFYKGALKIKKITQYSKKNDKIPIHSINYDENRSLE